MKRDRGFSLVEVAISATVLATAALLLSASLAAANGQKAAARRHGLAKSLAVRQLELFQQRISESQLLVPHAGIGVTGPNSSLRIDSLRAAGRTYTLANDGGPNVYSPHSFCYRNRAPDGRPVSDGGNYLVPTASTYHVMFPSANLRTTPASVPNPVGSMFSDEIERINSEQLAVELYVSACNMQGNRDSNFGNGLLHPIMETPDLLIAQVIIRDTSTGNEMFTLSRMFRVLNRQVFVPEGQF